MKRRYQERYWYYLEFRHSVFKSLNIDPSIDGIAMFRRDRQFATRSVSNVARRESYQSFLS